MATRKEEREQRRQERVEQEQRERDAAANRGTCGFCGFGGGYLGDQGDETTQYLNATVRTGEAPDFEYEQHPKAWGTESRYPGLVTWCANCVGGLKHKFQRYDDQNLRALMLSAQLRLELDGLRWTGWERDPKDEKERVIRKYLDDPGVHGEKLRLERDLRDMRNETFRRYGHDLTKQGWRP